MTTSTNSQRQIRRPRFVACDPSRLRISPGRFARTLAAPPERVSQLRMTEMSSSNTTSAMPVRKISVSHAGSFSGDVAREGVAVCRSSSASGMSGSDLAETGLDVAERDEVSIVYGAGFTVGDSLAVDVRAVGRSGVGDEQRAEVVHSERRMNF